MDKRQATEEWARSFNAIPTEMIRKLWEHEPEDWHEVTTPSASGGDWVYVYERGTYGEITKVNDEVYTVELDETREVVTVTAEDFEVDYATLLPMWGTMWSFNDSADDYWVEELDGIRKLSECGFRVYESEEFGYFFGIDGMGYSFYEAHWIPLYEARGLRWHDRENQE